jgi:hypothetical protein
MLADGRTRVKIEPLPHGDDTRSGDLRSWGHQHLLSFRQLRQEKPGLNLKTEGGKGILC